MKDNEMDQYIYITRLNSKISLKMAFQRLNYSKYILFHKDNENGNCKNIFYLLSYLLANGKQLQISGLQYAQTKTIVKSQP